MNRIGILLAALLFAGAAHAAEANLGEVSFSNSGTPAAQAPFLTGLKLLHNFEYEDAAAAFQKAEAADPGFAMAYWGEAMTYNHPVWMEQDPNAARAALAKLAPTREARLAKAKTPRERAYLNALEILYGDGGKEERDFKYADAMAALHAQYPDDVDATAFYALALLGTAHRGRDFATYMKAAALLEEVLPTHPLHPGVLHYLIHSYDDPIHAPLGLRAARVYGRVAGAAPHALHMTSHIYIALGMWDEVIAANIASTSAGHEKQRARGMPPIYCGHGELWLVYSYLQEKRDAQALNEIARCRANAEADKSKPTDQPLDPDDRKSTSYAEMCLFDAIETKRLATECAPVIPANDNAPAAFIQAYRDTLLANDVAGTEAALARLKLLAPKMMALIAKQEIDDPADAERVQIVLAQAEALRAARSGKTDAAISLLRKTLMEETGAPLEFGPPAIEKPTGELLGECLLAANKPAEAIPAFKATLARAPGRTLSLEGLAKADQAVGDADAASQVDAQLAKYVKENRS